MRLARGTRSAGGAGILRPRPDWIEVLELLYDGRADDASWGRDVVGSIKRSIVQSEAVGFVAVGHDEDCVHVRKISNSATWSPDSDWARRLGASPLGPDRPDYDGWGPDLFRAFFFPPQMVTTYRELESSAAANVERDAREQRTIAGIDDAAGIVVHPEPGVAAVLYARLDRPTSLTHNERRALTQLGLHFENAFRLRRRPQDVRGVVDVAGGLRIELASEDRRARGAVADAARRIDSVLSSPHRGAHDSALDLWRALIAGRFSLVPYVSGASRRYAVLENSPRSHPMRALSRREIDVLAIAARGVPSKLVAYGLGLSTSAVSCALRDASAKIGILTRLELVRIAAILAGDPRANASSASLTSAEREILTLLRQGLSNAAIARQRARSVRTIANQVGSLLRKMNAASRRALIAASDVTFAPEPRRRP